MGCDVLARVGAGLRNRVLQLLLGAGLCAAGAVRADSVVVFNEVMYHPASTNEAALEWLELFNQMAVDVDLSAWSLDGGVRYVFPEGTIIKGGGYLVVASSPETLRSTAGVTNVLGPFVGRLSNAGDKLRLFNRNLRLLDELDYGVEGDWPVGADGAGVSLAKRDENTASGPANSWTVSAMVGGTPGRRNFADRTFEVVTSDSVVVGSVWSYQAGGQPAGGWTTGDFDDSGWARGAGLFRASGGAQPPQGDPEVVPTIASTGVGTNGVVLAPGTPDPHYQILASAQGAPPPPIVPALVIQNHPAWLANDATSSWIGVLNPGEANVAAGAYNYRTTFSLDGFDPSSVSITLRIGADNRLNDILLNGVSQGISYAGFSSLSGPFVLDRGFVSGTNTLDFLSYNDGDGANPAGFRVVANGTGRRQFTVRTTLANGKTSYYFRTPFVVAGDPSQTSLQMSSVVADGAVFYLNGKEVYRQNLPPGEVGGATGAVTNVPLPLYQGPMILPAASLVRGTNCLAVEVHAFPGVADGVLFGAALSVTTTNVLVPPPVSLAFNELASASEPGFWLELINHGASQLDLNGIVVRRVGGTGSKDFALPAQMLPAGGTIVLGKATMGFGADPGDRLFLLRPDGASVLDAVVAKRLPRGRWPDGTGRWLHPSAPTPGEANRFELHGEIVVNELMFHPTFQAVSTNSDAATWFELLNRGATDLDLTGWKVAGDVDYAFDPGTVLGAGAYLVVAKDRDWVRSHHPGVVAVGPFGGRLKGGGGLVTVLDPSGNPASEVRYGDSKPWPEYADGGGASLELKDPNADPSAPESWASSNEAGTSGWTNVAYRAVAKNVLGPTLWNEFVVGLLDAGECYIDDLHVVESPATTKIQVLRNGDFETGTTAWRILGTHQTSRVEVDPGNPSNHVLHIVATGPTEHLHNHLETTFATGRSIVEGREYEISFRAKWLAGDNHLNTRLYFNRVAKTTALPVPSAHGTPGARNSTWVTNAGPTLLNFSHAPIVPQPRTAVTVSVDAADPDRVASVSLLWAVNGGTWTIVPMSPGASSRTPGYTNYAAVIPGQVAGAVIQFYVKAADSLGAVSYYPAGGSASRALIKVDEGKGLMTQVHRFQLWTTAEDAAILHAHTNVMGDARIGATVIYDEREVFYDAGIHLQSSQRGRDNSYRVGFNIKFPSNKLFRGVQPVITIDRSGGYSGRGARHDEILLWTAVNHAGGIMGLDCDLAQVFAPRADEDSTGLIRMSAFDGAYFDNQFQDGGSGNMYKLELIYYPLTTATGDAQAPKLPQPDDVLNVDIQNWGDAVENYRWIFLQENHADQDDYSRIIALNKAMSNSGAALDTQSSLIMDVDQWMRTLAFKAFTGDVDTFTYGLNHNWKMYFRPGDGKAMGLLWDMDFAFAQGVNYGSPGSGSASTYRLAMLPNNYRRFCNHLYDIMASTVNRDYLARWASHYGGLLGQDWSGAVDYMQQRADYLKTSLPLSTAFAITSNGGKGFTTTSSNVLLTGTAPINVRAIQVNGVEMPIRWTALTTWTLTVPLPSLINNLVLTGVDNAGNTIIAASATITVTNMGATAPKPVLINEWMADNADPGGFPDLVGGLFSDWFELFNPNPVPVNLSGYSLTDAAAQPDLFRIPTNTVISAKGFLLVWADGRTELNNGAGPLHAGFKLSKSGDSIGLYSPDGVLQHWVTFGSQVQNVSQGYYPDGDTNHLEWMPAYTPGASNKLGSPTAPSLLLKSSDDAAKISMSVLGVANRAYRLEYTEDITGAVWKSLGYFRAGADGQAAFSEAIAEGHQRYYRAVVAE